jgi:hypothetical protein
LVAQIFWSPLYKVHKLISTILKLPPWHRKIHDNQYKGNSSPIWNRAIYRHSHTPPLVPLISQFNSDHVTTNHFLWIHFHIVLILPNNHPVRGFLALRATLKRPFQSHFCKKKTYTELGDEENKIKKHSFWIIRHKFLCNKYVNSELKLHSYFKLNCVEWINYFALSLRCIASEKINKFNNNISYSSHCETNISWHVFLQLNW